MAKSKPGDGKQPTKSSVDLSPPAPTHRQLRGYAFDPSLATQLETALVSEITYKVPWEKVTRGPSGEYVEVVDFDPPTGCFYAPIDLDHPHVVAQDGLAPSEGTPQFHQQFVYAVTMTTIDRFERALGRKAFWASRYVPSNPKGKRDVYVPKLRIYPHAMRMANAYYSRDKTALLFGYFPATQDRRSGQYPGGMVFTCLSHDVIAHETTHALLDGFHEDFMVPTNPDVLAFHEAFADIVALFQHFTFPEVLVHQVARTRGELRSENLLGQLATQFGHARGMHGALRDAIGKFDPALNKWVAHKPDPTELDETLEVHGRGAILVAAVFDAFLSIYQHRSRDLLRIATGGSGELEKGDLHPDLVQRLAQEASKAASHVLNMCIRALDYCPPVDLTFGEYLRALITADMDLIPEDEHGYRVAFIEAFRRRGIYPRDVRTLSEDSLRWAPPAEDLLLSREEMREAVMSFVEGVGLRGKVDKLRYLREREEIWNYTRGVREELHDRIKAYAPKALLLERLTGLSLRKKSTGGKPSFYVRAFREARRLKDDGRVLNQVFLTIIQKQHVKVDGQTEEVLCGSTLIFNLDDMDVMYVVRKGIGSDSRVRRLAEFRAAGMSLDSLASTYFGSSSERFAALHHVGA